MKPVISCVCPTHGRAHIIGEAVESWRRQRPCGFPTELLIVNDCPEQPLTCDVPGVRIVNLDVPMTINAKFNLAVELAVGNYVAWWEDDDISLPHRLARSVAQSRMETTYKQRTAWLWAQDGLTPTGNMFFGTAFFSRRLFLDSGGAGDVGAPDVTALRNMAGAGEVIDEAAAAQDMFFVYRWGGIQVIHDSGFYGADGMSSPSARLAEYRRRTLEHPVFRPGVQKIVPAWRRDYMNMANLAVARLAESDRGRKSYWAKSGTIIPGRH